MSAMERASKASSVKQAMRSKRTSERCERTSERTSEWPSTYVSIHGCFEQQCVGPSVNPLAGCREDTAKMPQTNPQTFALQTSSSTPLRCLIITNPNYPVILEEGGGGGEKGQGRGLDPRGHNWEYPQFRIVEAFWLAIVTNNRIPKNKRTKKNKKTKQNKKEKKEAKT